MERAQRQQQEFKDEELARQLQREQQSADIRPPTLVTATAGYSQVAGEQALGEPQLSQEARAVLARIQQIRPQHLSRSGVDLSGAAVAQGVVRASVQTTQHVRNANAIHREGISFAGLMTKLSMQGESELVHVNFDSVAFLDIGDVSGFQAALLPSLINGRAVLTSHRLLFLTAADNEVVRIDGGPIPNFTEANAGCCRLFCTVCCCTETPTPGLHYEVTAAKTTSNNFIPIDLKDIQRGISFSVFTENASAVGVNYRRKEEPGGCMPSFIYPPAFDQVRGQQSSNMRMITLGLTLPPWKSRSTVKIAVSQSDSLSDIAHFVSKLQELASGDAS